MSRLFLRGLRRLPFLAISVGTMVQTESRLVSLVHINLTRRDAGSQEFAAAIITADETPVDFVESMMEELVTRSRSAAIRAGTPGRSILPCHLHKSGFSRFTCQSAF